MSTDNVELAELKHPSKYDIRSLMFVSMILGTFTALFELVFFAIIKNQPIATSRTSLYLYLTLLGFMVIFCVRNRGHFWKAPKLSFPLKAAFGVIALVSTLLIYIRPTQVLFSFHALSLRSLALIIGMTLLYLLFLDTIKVWFFKSKPTTAS
jgi:Zn-dependent protease with chaperone function